MLCQKKNWCNFSMFGIDVKSSKTFSIRKYWLWLGSDIIFKEQLYHMCRFFEFSIGTSQCRKCCQYGICMTSHVFVCLCLYFCFSSAIWLWILLFWFKRKKFNRKFGKCFSNDRYTFGMFVCEYFVCEFFFFWRMKTKRSNNKKKKKIILMCKT